MKIRFAATAATKMRQIFFTLILSGGVVMTALFAQAQPLSSTVPRTHQVIDMTRVNESWALDWKVTHTAVVFPEGGRAGFYRRATRMKSAVPHMGRLGILYLYPQSDYKPACIIRRHIKITQATSRLVLSVCANRSPRGEWILQVLVDGRQLGDEILISGQDGWRDIACNLSGFLGRRVDIEIQAYMSIRRAAHVYIDEIRLEDPLRQPISSLSESGKGNSKIFDFTPTKFNVDPIDDSTFFDIYYRNFLELLQDREERRRYDYMQNVIKFGKCPKRPK